MLGKFSKIKRIRKHGFMDRLKNHPKVLKSRRAKGRKSLAVTIHSKAK